MNDGCSEAQFGESVVGSVLERRFALDLETRDCTVTYSRGGKKLAAAFVHRDLDGLRAELEFERANKGPTA